MEPQDTIVVAPGVLITIARYATLEVEGVARMGTVPANVLRLFRRATTAHGVVLDIEENQATLELYIVVDPNVNMREVAHDVQQAVTRSIKELVGMDVMAVNIHIHDVDY
jgi:uncharacterized alkaline shock family protein YloU